MPQPTSRRSNFYLGLFIVLVLIGMIIVSIIQSRQAIKLGTQPTSKPFLKAPEDE